MLSHPIQFFLRIAASADPNGIKTLLSNNLTTFPIKGNPDFIDDPKILPKNPPNVPILYSLVFDIRVSYIS